MRGVVAYFNRPIIFNQLIIFDHPIIFNHLIIFDRPIIFGEVTVLGVILFTAVKRVGGNCPHKAAWMMVVVIGSPRYLIICPLY